MTEVQPVASGTGLDQWPHDLIHGVSEHFLPTPPYVISSAALGASEVSEGWLLQKVSGPEGPGTKDDSTDPRQTGQTNTTSQDETEDALTDQWHRVVRAIRRAAGIARDSSASDELGAMLLTDTLQRLVEWNQPLTLRLLRMAVEAGELSAAETAEVLEHLGSVPGLSEGEEVRVFLEAHLSAESPLVRDGALLGLDNLQASSSVAALRAAAEMETVSSLKHGMLKLADALG